ncbi:polysaccharide biosynthesis C-terminal domain-containing protein [Albibacterium bauzanense]|uniref:UDP-2-acetamido-2,6-beta-L-arabino-hexul-4-ose reductase n=1 Tax=Albibacterium bauzanense TaxID=653929 RepID=A0A4R1M0Z2_9SPHI|nr:NAD-dependent epimerase/dehydratase family protein [Albibacterium bauzanense]TCK84882.1 UDP-2-acetamido-2,6-beta-L-arabino-hexul-4-ose reductase [Albibacterium bauzanense]
MKLKVGITGQNGFVGKHLYNMLCLFPDEFERIEFKKEYFADLSSLDQFTSSCDVIVHLAAMNRHSDPKVIYTTNIALVESLIESLIRTKSKSHILFSSSSQESKDNMYGKSKKEGRELFIKWAEEFNGQFTGMVIPNVFGPFGRPFYNSVIATFCHQLTHAEMPVIQIDGELNLIYIGELVEEFIQQIRSKKSNLNYQVIHTAHSKVSEILSLLNRYKEDYLEKGGIPAINSRFELNLFNTFRCYIDTENHFPVKFTQHIDPRGAFVEVIRLNVGGQVSFSTTVPGITRGNHFHTRKIERFAVIKGKALIQLRQIGTDQILDFYLSGEEPAYVDMPVWYTHNIKNIGEEELFTIFWINEFFDPNDTDTYFENV